MALLLLPLASALSPGSAWAAVDFSPPVSYPVGLGPNWVALGDLNLDGRLDIVVANSWAENLSVLLNNGGGRFRAAVSYPASTGRLSNPYQVAVADVNGDRRPDILAALAFHNSIAVLLNQGSGAFVSPPVEYAVGVGPRGLAVTDLNRDGRRDVVSADGVSGQQGSISVLLNAGSGRFQQPAASTPTPLAPRELEVRDFDRDGVLDLLVSTWADGSAGLLTWYRGVGAGSFAASAPFRPADADLSRPRIAIGDLNADGSDDVVSLGFLSDVLSVRLGEGDGGFRRAGADIRAADLLGALTLADIDGDGNLDVVASFWNGGAAVYLGNGHGGLLPAQLIPIGGTGIRAEGVSSIVSGDVNGDGKPDLVAGLEARDSVVVLLNQTLRPPIATRLGPLDPNLPLALKTANLQAGDLSGSGRLSVGSALTGLRMLVGLEPLSAVAAHTADLNGNRRLDPADVVLLLKGVAGLIPPNQIPRPEPLPGASVVTLSPSEVTAGGALLRGEVALDQVPADGLAEWHFRLTPPGGQPLETSSERARVEEPSILQVSTRVGWLAPETAYRVALVVTKPRSAEGRELAFTTAPAPRPRDPRESAVTLAPQQVTGRSALLRGQVSLPPGQRAQAYFQVTPLVVPPTAGPLAPADPEAPRPEPRLSQPPQALLTTGAPQAVTFPASPETGLALEPHTRYRVALVVETEEGTRWEAEPAIFRTGYEAVPGVDSDGDGYTDADEAALASDPSSATSVPATFLASPLVSYLHGTTDGPRGGSPKAALPPVLTGGVGERGFYSGSTGADGPLVFHTPPPASFDGAMAYDADRRVVVLYGGAGAWSRSTFEWDGTVWAERKTEHAPPILEGSSYGWGGGRMAYDRARKVMVLYGGHSAGRPLPDTWEYDGTDWIQRSPAHSPGPREGFALAYDAARKQTVLRSGRETWTYDGLDWTKQADTTADLSGAALAYDEKRERVVLYGGYEAREGANGGARTWEWDGSVWRERPSSGGPGPRTAHAMAWDGARGEVVLFGNGWSGANSAETWAWDGTAWLQRTVDPSPPGRQGLMLAYDEARGQIVLFGGQLSAQGSPTANDTWLWDGQGWRAPLSVQPEPVLDLEGRPDGVFHYTSIDIPEGVKVRFRSSRANTPVIWLASGDVRIAGEVSLDGASATADPTPGTEAPGGPGGYSGGRGGNRTTQAPGTPGQGPGGGLPGIGAGDRGGDARYQEGEAQPRAGIPYGSRLLQPLLGGSGGGGEGSGGFYGHGLGGSGGGGALLLAASGIIRIEGSLHANAGGFGNGKGSGGAIRLVAPRVEGRGQVTAQGGGRGWVRVETDALGPDLRLDPAPVTAPPLALEPPRVGWVRLVGVGGQAVPRTPWGSTALPDVVFQATGGVLMELETAGVPAGTVLAVRATWAGQAVTVPTTPVDAQGKATVRLALPTGEGTLQAYGTYTAP